MEICVSDSKLSELFGCRSKIIQKFGEKSGLIIGQRLALLYSAPCLGDLPSEPPDTLVAFENGAGFEFAFGSGDPAEIQFKPSGLLIREEPSSKVLKTIQKIMLTRVGR